MPTVGFSNEAIDYFGSHLSSRKFHENIHEEFSTAAYFRCGLPQGPILGPYYFQHVLAK